MHGDLRIYAFSFRGLAVSVAPPVSAGATANQEGDGASKVDDHEATEARWLPQAATLNEQSDKIASQIESQLRRMLPPYVRVEAEIHFLVQSLIVEGSILLLSWAGSTILKAAKEEMETQLSGVVRGCVLRVVNRFLRQAVLADVEVEAVATPDASDDAATPARDRDRGWSPAFWMSLVSLLLALILLLDRFFTISVR